MGDKKLTHIKGWLVRHSDGLNLVLELKVVCVLSLVSIKAGIDQCMGNYPISSLNLLIGSSQCQHRYLFEAYEVHNLSTVV